MLVAAEPVPPPSGKPETQESSVLQARLREIERQTILRTLSRVRGNKTRAAKELGIARKTLYEKLKRLGIGPD